MITVGSTYAADTAELQRKFAALPDTVQERVLKPIMREAAAMVASAEKAEAPEETGLLKTALGASTTRTYRHEGGSSKLFIAVGARRGFRRAVQATPRGRKMGRVLSAARTEAGEGDQVRNPTKYLHLVTGGRKAIHATNAKILYAALANRFLGKSVEAAKPDPFMERAYQDVAGRVADFVTEAAAERIEAAANA